MVARNSFLARADWSLNTATKSRPMHATIELKMEYVARARASAPGSRIRF